MTLKQKMFDLNVAHPHWKVPDLARALNKKPEIIRAMMYQYEIPVPRMTAAEAKRIKKAAARIAS